MSRAAIDWWPKPNKPRWSRTLRVPATEPRARGAVRPLVIQGLEAVKDMQWDVGGVGGDRRGRSGGLATAAVGVTWERMNTTQAARAPVRDGSQ